MYCSTCNNAKCWVYAFKVDSGAVTHCNGCGEKWKLPKKKKKPRNRSRERGNSVPKDGDGAGGSRAGGTRGTDADSLSWEALAAAATTTEHRELLDTLRASVEKDKPLRKPMGDVWKATRQLEKRTKASEAAAQAVAEAKEQLASREADLEKAAQEEEEAREALKAATAAVAPGDNDGWPFHVCDPADPEAAFPDDATFDPADREAMGRDRLEYGDSIRAFKAAQAQLEAARGKAKDWQARSPEKTGGDDSEKEDDLGFGNFDLFGETPDQRDASDMAVDAGAVPSDPSKLVAGGANIAKAKSAPTPKTQADSILAAARTKAKDAKSFAAASAGASSKG